MDEFNTARRYYRICLERAYPNGNATQKVKLIFWMVASMRAMGVRNMFDIIGAIDGVGGESVMNAETVRIVERANEVMP